MKVFFTGSPRALKTLKLEHEIIFRTIEESGHHNLSDLVVKADPDKFYELDQSKVIKHYQDTIHNLKVADILIAEVSLHSMSMGYLVNKALEMGKPVIVLHQEKTTPFFFSGIENDKLQVLAYNLENLRTVVKEAVEYAQESSDFRFNFFISPSIGTYLDWISKEKKIPRSVYLRNLIEKDMHNNGEYNA